MLVLVLVLSLQPLQETLPVLQQRGLRSKL